MSLYMEGYYHILEEESLLQILIQKYLPFKDFQRNNNKLNIKNLSEGETIIPSSTFACQNCKRTTEETAILFDAKFGDILCKECSIILNNSENKLK